MDLGAKHFEELDKNRVREILDSGDDIPNELGRRVMQTLGVSEPAGDGGPYIEPEKEKEIVHMYHQVNELLRLVRGLEEDPTNPELIRKINAQAGEIDATINVNKAESIISYQVPGVVSY